MEVDSNPQVKAKVKFNREPATTHWSCDPYKAPVGMTKDKCAESQAKKNLAVVCNPWYPTETPKYPDGKAQWSIGRKFRFTSEIRSNPSGEVLLMLFPGVNNYCCAIRSQTSMEGATQYQLLANHVAETGITFKVTQTVNGDTRRYVLSPEDKSFESWRPVSLGLRLKCLNTDEEDGGWWESIRTTSDKVFRGFGIAVATGIQGGTASKKTFNGNVLPKFNTVLRQSHERQSDWANNPSYTTGKLTHLGFYDFQLNYIREDNDFIRLSTLDLQKFKVEYFTEYPSDNTVDSMGLGYQEDADTSEAQVWHTSRPREVMVAESMDIILIRIHGTKETKLFTDSVYNQEVLVPQEGAYSTYQTPTLSRRDTLEKIVRVRNEEYLLPYQSTRRAAKGK